MVGIFTQAKQFIATATDNESLLHLEITVLSLDGTLKMLNDGDEKKIVKETNEELSPKENQFQVRRGPVVKN